jgi:hypothetical protein
MRINKRIVPVIFLSLSIGLSSLISLVPSPRGTNSVSAATGISLEYLGRANSGSGLGGSEISAYDVKSKRLFVTNGAKNAIDFFDISDPISPVFLKTVNLATLGVTGIQSVASKAGYVAAAASVDGNNQAAGKIFLMDMDGNIDNRAATGVVVGSLPDSVHFSPDGKYLLSANEGEPKDYCLTDGALPTTTDPYGSVSIIDVTAKTLAAITLDFSDFNDKAADIRTAGGRIYGPGATVAQDVEPEYIAISGDSKKAFVTLQENNSVAEIDLTTKKVVQLMGLGYKDFNAVGNGLDPSDQDSSSNSGINIANWPVKGMYEPDAIATFTDAAGNHYFATANEGDAREYKCLLGGLSSGSAQAEDARVSAVGVDGTILASTLATNSNLGRLGMTRFEPATYTNGGTALTATSSTDFTSLYTLGARSLSIWKSPTGTNSIAGATLVGDTGDVIEKKIAELLPTYFNADWNTSTGTPNTKDSRSDNKGPEPEGLAVAKVFGRTVAFVGLERVGGVMAFDITAPSKPEYLTYTNSSLFTGVAGANFANGVSAGDVSPEGVLFIKASESPTGDPLVVVAHELSGTTAIYKVVGGVTAPSQPLNVTASVSTYKAKITWTAPEDDGGKPVTSYLVKAVPGPDSCITTTTSCEIKGLQAGVKYQFTVIARNSATSGAVSVASNSVQTKFFASNVGRAVSIAKKPVSSFASDVAIFSQGKNISVGVITPRSKDAGQQVIRYSVEIRNATGKKLASFLVVTKAGETVLKTLKSTQSGRVRVIVAASQRNSKKTIWNGPFINLE